jgi:purine-binding chemotaxis protein CheW
MAASTVTRAGHYITFRLGDELFAINVVQVREVLDMSVITRVPRAPSYMRGVVNVRGSAIPVVDLRIKFGLPAAADTVNSRIVVLELSLDGETAVVGGIADSVHDVIELEPAQIEEAPRMAMRWRAELVQGMGRRGDEFVIILDIDKVFSSDDVAQIGPLAEAAEAEALESPALAAPPVARADATV